MIARASGEERGVIPDRLRAAMAGQADAGSSLAPARLSTTEKIRDGAHHLKPDISTLLPSINVDTLLSEALQSFDGLGVWSPPCNAYEDEHGFCVQAALSGMERKDIELTRR